MEVSLEGGQDQESTDEAYRITEQGSGGGGDSSGDVEIGLGHLGGSRKSLPWSQEFRRRGESNEKERTTHRERYIVQSSRIITQ